MDGESSFRRTVVAAGIRTAYHELGASSARPVVLLHGSGPGVSAWSNWAGVAPLLGERFRVLAPDVVGFGHTERPESAVYDIRLWTQHLLGFLDTLSLEKVSIVGNSFGGSLALALALRHHARVDRLVLMGTPIGTFEQTPGLASAWEYEPSLDNMERVLRLFPYEQRFVTPSMIRDRYEASLRFGGQSALRKLLPRPAPEGEVTMVRAIPEEQLQKLPHRALVLHGREDRVVPPRCGIRIHENIVHSELRMFGECGHWVQIERKEAFVEAVNGFLEAAS